MAYNGINPRSNKDFNFDIEILDSLLPPFLDEGEGSAHYLCSL